MKNIKLILLPLFLISSLSGCNKTNNKGREYKEDFLYVGPIYEPLQIAKSGTEIDKVEILGLYNPIRCTEFDEADVVLRAWYKDNTTNSIPVKEKNIPVDYRHFLGEVGHHEFNLLIDNEELTFDFTISENPDFKGHTCYFYNKDKVLMDTEVVGHYQPVTYKGEPLPEVIDDKDYQYIYQGWNYQTNYIHQDMQFIAKYKECEKRLTAVKPYNNEYVGLASLVNKDKTTGSSMMYLGRVNRVAAIYSEVKELIDEDISLEFEKNYDYGKYWNSINESILDNVVTYRTDPEYNTKIYGNAYQIVSEPTFLSSFDNRYDFNDVSVYLEDGNDVKISKENPFDTSLNRIKGYVQNKATITKDKEDGFYRLAIIASYDVYLSVSFNKLGYDQYEIGDFNNFIISPVYDSFKYVIQYSEDGNFINNFPSSLVVSTKMLYNAADMIDWSQW